MVPGPQLNYWLSRGTPMGCGEGATDSCGWQHLPGSQCEGDPKGGSGQDLGPGGSHQSPSQDPQGPAGGQP